MKERRSVIISPLLLSACSKESSRESDMGNYEIFRVRVLTSRVRVFHTPLERMRKKDKRKKEMTLPSGDSRHHYILSVFFLSSFYSLKPNRLPIYL
jgi:hypothetical protein